jgi:hypothetical protein
MVASMTLAEEREFAASLDPVTELSAMSALVTPPSTMPDESTGAVSAARAFRVRALRNVQRAAHHGHNVELGLLTGHRGSGEGNRDHDAENDRHAGTTHRPAPKSDGLRRACADS